MPGAGSGFRRPRVVRNTELLSAPLRRKCGALIIARDGGSRRRAGKSEDKKHPAPRVPFGGTATTHEPASLSFHNNTQEGRGAPPAGGRRGRGGGAGAR